MQSRKNARKEGLSEVVPGVYRTVCEPYDGGTRYVHRLAMKEKPTYEAACSLQEKLDRLASKLHENEYCMVAEGHILHSDLGYLEVGITVYHAEEGADRQIIDELEAFMRHVPRKLGIREDRQPHGATAIMGMLRRVLKGTSGTGDAGAGGPDR